MVAVNVPNGYNYRQQIIAEHLPGQCVVFVNLYLLSGLSITTSEVYLNPIFQPILRSDLTAH